MQLISALCYSCGASLLVAGCADDAIGDDAGAVDAQVFVDAGPCGELVVDPAWLDGYVPDAVAKLSGDLAITGDVHLADRASASARELVRDWLIDQLAAQGVAGELHTYGMGANVVARLPGDDPAAGWILIGAHFDTVNGSPGADDNATGVAAVLATSRILRDTCRQRGLIVAFFDQEEIGLIGSSYLANDLFVADENIVEVHTVDQVGWDNDGDRVFEIELPTATLYQRYQAAAAALGFGTRETDTSGTDHTSFRDRGFAAVGLTEEYVAGDTTPNYHQPTDTFDTVNLGFTADAVKLLAAVVGAEIR